MNHTKPGPLMVLLMVTFFVSQLGAAAPTLAQQSPTTARASEKWRPKEGLYAVPGHEFDANCLEYGDLNIGLGTNDISGHEWSCKVNELADNAPNEIRVKMTCSDYNLAGNLHLPEDKEFKEVMVLKKIDEKTILVRKSLNGQLKGPAWRAAYCPEKAQQMYRDNIAKEKEDAAQRAEWERKAAEERKAIEARKAAAEKSTPSK